MQNIFNSFYNIIILQYYNIILLVLYNEISRILYKYKYACYDVKKV